MNVYVPASSAPPSPGWKQKLSIVVVFGSGLAIAAVATSTFDRPGKLAPTTKVVLPPAPLPGPSLGSIAPAPAQVSDALVAAPTPATAKSKEPPPPPRPAPVYRTQLFFTQPATGIEPTALPPEPSHRPPPSSFMPPLASPGTPVERGVSTSAPRRTTAVHVMSRSSVYVSPAHIAVIDTGLGELALALDRLEEAVKVRAADLVWLAVKPSYDALRGEPRFQAVLDTVGLASVRLPVAPTR